MLLAILVCVDAVVVVAKKVSATKHITTSNTCHSALRPNAKVKACGIEPWRQHRYSLAFRIQYLPAFTCHKNLTLRLKVCRGAQISLTQIVATTTQPPSCLFRAAIWFVATCYLLQMLLSSIAKESVWAIERKSVQPIG